MKKPFNGGLSLLEVLLSVLLLSICSISVYQNMTLALQTSIQAKTRLSCVVAGNNLIELAMASSTPLLTGLRKQLAGTGAPVGLDTYATLPMSLQPLGTLGLVEGKVAKTAASYTTIPGAETATDVAILTIRDPLTNNETRLQVYRYPLE